MSILTTITRMWLTRSLRSFKFTCDYDENLSFCDTVNLGLYIHIPFCRNICSFCPYCKEKYVKGYCDKYIDNLIKEIHMVGSALNNKQQVTSLYFGGGTPALAIDRLDEIIFVINSYFIITQGIGLELHPEDVTVANLKKLKEIGITKISIGIQSFQDKFLQLLGRQKSDIMLISRALKQVSFDTVSMDFIFALPGQDFMSLKEDIDTAFEIGANHIAIYPFIDFTFAKSGIPPMHIVDKKKLLDEITLYCLNKGYTRESIWTFSNKPDKRYSSMTRDNFLGFGCSATTLLKDRFKINTFSIDEYIKRIDKGRLPTSLTLRFYARQRMIYYLFWTAYTTKISKEAFKMFFNVPLKKYFWLELWFAKKFGFITEADDEYIMTLKGAFYYHYYENYYTLAYIDKMWGIMKEEAFPKEICL